MTQSSKPPKHTSWSDLDLNRWREYEEIKTDSLWIYPNRASGDGHKLDYHGNYIPQIATQLLTRYSKKDEIVLDLFLGSGTTAIEAARLGRRCIGVELKPELVEDVRGKISPELLDSRVHLLQGNSAAPETICRVIDTLAAMQAKMAHLLILHPPYADIIKFSDRPDDLSNAPTTEAFLDGFEVVARHGYELLDLSKIEAGKMELEIGPVSIEGVCGASLRLIKQLVHKKRLHVSQTLNSSGEAMQADERRLKQMLVNLLSNAVKFTPEDGQIGLEVVADEAEQIVHFTVWDTGIGIAQEDMRRLFQPFVQLDSRLARQYAGTGLGLSLVSRMAELHGGGISVESQVGQGSRFTISLPWTRPASAAAAIKESSPEINFSLAAPTKNGQPYRILLVDDNEDNINLCQDYLQSTGYHVIVARNGREAIARTQEDKPDLILMDIQMPEMDGLEATRRLRADVALAPIPIITVPLAGSPRSFPPGTGSRRVDPLQFWPP